MEARMDFRKASPQGAKVMSELQLSYTSADLSIRSSNL